MRTKVVIEDGIKWIYRYKKRPKDAAQPQRLSLPLYTAHYKCNRCGHGWGTVSQIRPLSSVPCLLTGCSKPSFLVALIRQIKKEKMDGYGRLICVEVNTWE